MVTTRHAAAEQAAHVEQVAPRSGRTGRRQREEQEQEEEERAWQEVRRAELRRRQHKIAAQRAELQERRTGRAEGKREREALWVDHCNRQNQHIAALHESWEAPPPKPLPPPVGDPPLSKRRKPQPWTAEEVEALEEYVAQHGTHNWAFILKQDKAGDKMFHREEANEGGEPEWVPTRTNVDLKDKWRYLQRQLERTPGRRRRTGQQVQHPQLPWTEAEEHGLVRLVAQHGTSNWQLIKDSPEGQAVFHDIRTNVDLKTKWDLLVRKPQVMAQLRAHQRRRAQQAQQQAAQQQAQAQQQVQQQVQQQQVQQQQAQQPQTQQPLGRLGTAAARAGGVASRSREVGRPTPARRQKAQQLHLVQPQRLDFEHV